MKKLLFLITLLIAYPLFGDKIFLFNNSVNKGTVINITSDFIEYSTQENVKVKLARDQAEKIVYDNGKEVEFYDKIYFSDGTVIKGRVIKTSGEYLEYNPAGPIPYDKTEMSNVAKIIYDSGKVQSYQKAADTDLIYFKDGRTVKAWNILISDKKNIEYLDEKNNKQFYGLNMIEKIVYKDGRTEYPEKIQHTDKSSSKTGSGKPVETFLELEWGWNGYAGLGPRVDFFIFNNVSFNGAAGLGLWGLRLSGAFRYYIEYPYGLAFSAGVAYNNGGESKMDLDTEDPDNGNIYSEKVKLKLKPVTCINASILYSIKVNGNDKIYIETGYSYALQKDKYSYTTESGRPLSDKSEDIIDLYAPGGFMIAAGYAFAL